MSWIVQSLKVTRCFVLFSGIITLGCLSVWFNGINTVRSKHNVGHPSSTRSYPPKPAEVRILSIYANATNRQRFVSRMNESLVKPVGDWRPLMDSSMLVSDTWRQLGDGLETYVYSAWLEDRVDKWGSVVRIIGTSVVSYLRPTPPSHCLLWFPDDPNSPRHVPLEWEDTHKTVEGGNRQPRRYDVFYWFCPTWGAVRYNKSHPLAGNVAALPWRVPTGVAITTDNLQYETERLPVHAARRRIPSPSIGLCIRPIYGDIHPETVVEFVELYRLMGVSHFLFYVHELFSPGIAQVLAMYMEEGLLEVARFKLDIDTHSYGVKMAINECIYRLMYKHKYVVMVDLDEFLVPRQHVDLNEMLQDIVKDSVGAVMFRNAFFYKGYPPEALSANVTPKLLTLTHTLRRKDIHQPTVRSKLIVLPHKLLHVGNHLVWRYMPRKDGGKYMTLILKPEEGLNNHYRACDVGRCIERYKPVRDDALFKRYKDKLPPLVDERLKQLRKL